MKYSGFFLFLTLFYFSHSVTAQNNKVKDEKVISESADKFAFNYGIILGNNLKGLDIELNAVSFDKILEGIRGMMDEKNSTLSQRDAQNMINQKLNDIQKEKEAVEQGKKTKKSELADLESFFFNYGILIGANWKNFDIPVDDVSLSDFQNGVTAMMSGKNPSLNEQAAQKVVSQKFQEMQRLKAEKQQQNDDAFMEEVKKNTNVISLPSGLSYEIIKEGTGPQPISSSMLTAHYHGTLPDGTVFDSSVEKGKPINFALTGVIKGWQEILPLMKTGGKVKAYIPPHLAYGNRSRGKIPANALLVFEIELISVE